MLAPMRRHGHEGGLGPAAATVERWSGPAARPTRDGKAPA